MRNIYAIGFVRGRRVHYLPTRETNYRRACKTLRDMLKDNKRYKAGVVALVKFAKDGTESDLIHLYEKSIR
jgi:hypothetical protein